MVQRYYIKCRQRTEHMFSEPSYSTCQFAPPGDVCSDAKEFDPEEGEGEYVFGSVRKPGECPQCEAEKRQREEAARDERVNVNGPRWFFR